MKNTFHSLFLHISCTEARNERFVYFLEYRLLIVSSFDANYGKVM